MEEPPSNAKRSRTDHENDEEAMSAQDIAMADRTEAPKPRKFWPLVIRIVVAIALFAWLGTHLDWKSIGATLAAIDPKWAALALLVLWTGLGIAVVRWHV